MQNPAISTCEQCDKEIFEGAPCEWCEQNLCERDSKLHDCVGHDPEIVLCVYCGGDCEISKGKLGGHETQPAKIDGDYACAACAYFKPWEVQKGQQFKAAM